MKRLVPVSIVAILAFFMVGFVTSIQPVEATFGKNRCNKGKVVRCLKRVLSSLRASNCCESEDSCSAAAGCTGRRGESTSESSAADVSVEAPAGSADEVPDAPDEDGSDEA